MQKTSRSASGFARLASCAGSPLCSLLTVQTTVQMMAQHYIACPVSYQGAQASASDEKQARDLWLVQLRQKCANLGCCTADDRKARNVFSSTEECFFRLDATVCPQFESCQTARSACQPTDTASQRTLNCIHQERTASMHHAPDRHNAQPVPRQYSYVTACHMQWEAIRDYGAIDLPITMPSDRMRVILPDLMFKSTLPLVSCGISKEDQEVLRAQLNALLLPPRDAQRAVAAASRSLKRPRTKSSLSPLDMRTMSLALQAADLEVCALLLPGHRVCACPSQR